MIPAIALVDFQRGTLNASKDGITGAAINSQTWQLDGVGNWASTVVDGQSQTQTISNMNAYLSFAGVTQTYDTNGNLTNDGNLTFAYDFANRMVEIRDNEDNSLIASYSYDAFNRRISKNRPILNRQPRGHQRQRIPIGSANHRALSLQ